MLAVIPDDCTIVVIDDDWGTCDTLRQMITATSKATVLCATDGQKGRDLVFEHKPDLVVLDLVMPKMGGFQVLQEIKSDDETLDIPVIVLTGNDSPDNMSKSLYLYAESYVTKPCDVRDFLQTVGKVLMRKRRERLSGNDLTARLGT